MINYKEEAGSHRDLLMLKEYGRNIQSLVDYLATVEDKEKRTKYAYTLVELMKQISGNNKEETDQKMWNHMHIMSGFNLDVDGPYPVPERDIMQRKPDKVEYNMNKLRYRHYGRNLELLIEQIKAMPEGQDKKDATIYLARMMKRFYANWNKDLVEDQLVLDQVKLVSKGELELDAKEVLEKGLLNMQLNIPTTTNSNQRSNNSRNHKKSNNRRKH